MTTNESRMPHLNRRQLLQASTLLLLGAPGRAASAPAKKTLVCVYLRGGLDGLSAVVPFGESRYYDARPTIAVPEPGKKHGCLALDQRFGLHPSLERLLPLYQSKQLALVHAAGSPHGTRSHFEAQDYLQTGVPGNAALTGWLNRYLAETPERERPLRAITVSAQIPRALQGPAPVFAISDPAQRIGSADGSVELAFQRLYANRDDGLSKSARSTLDTIDRVHRLAGGPYTPSNGAQYPAPGQHLMQLARLLKAGFEIEVAWLDFGGWDSHVGQRGHRSDLAKTLRTLGDTLAAFHTDMGEAMKDMVVMTMTEFGRTVAENGTGGTDHGHGGVLFVLGGGVRGGRIYGEWPGLAKKQLYSGRDLEVTTDYRRVLGDVVEDHLALRDLETVLPGYGHRRLGLFKAARS